jgi:hypothetical protein
LLPAPLFSSNFLTVLGLVDLQGWTLIWLKQSETYDLKGKCAALRTRSYWGAFMQCFKHLDAANQNAACCLRLSFLDEKL